MASSAEYTPLDEPSDDTSIDIVEDAVGPPDLSLPVGPPTQDDEEPSTSTATIDIVEDETLPPPAQQGGEAPGIIAGAMLSTISEPATSLAPLPEPVDSRSLQPLSPSPPAAPPRSPPTPERATPQLQPADETTPLAPTTPPIPQPVLLHPAPRNHRGGGGGVILQGLAILLALVLGVRLLVEVRSLRAQLDEQAQVVVQQQGSLEALQKQLLRDEKQQAVDASEVASKVDALAYEVQKFNRTVSNGEVVERLLEVELEMHDNKLWLNRSLSSMLNRLQTATAQDSLEISRQLELTETDVLEQLGQTTASLNNAVATAEDTIKAQVLEVKQSMTQYVLDTNQKFKNENDFLKYQLAGTFTLLSCLIALWHVSNHVRHMHNPNVQRRILAILWMVPVYASSSWLSLVFPHFREQLRVVRDCYEAYAVYTFFAFLCEVLLLEVKNNNGHSSSSSRSSPNSSRRRRDLATTTGSTMEMHHRQYLEEEQGVTGGGSSSSNGSGSGGGGSNGSGYDTELIRIISSQADRKLEASQDSPAYLRPPFYCPWGLRSVPSRRLARDSLWQCRFCLMQFVLLKPVLTLIPFILRVAGVDYDGHAPVMEGPNGHQVPDPTSPQLYVMLFTNLSVGLAFYGLLAFYHCVDDELAWAEPWPKFLCIKGVVFMTFWQGFVIGLVGQLGYIDPDSAMAAQDFLICVEMLLASLAHFYIFPHAQWEPGYRENKERDLAKAFKLRDTFAVRDFIHDLQHAMTRDEEEDNELSDSSMVEENEGSRGVSGDLTGGVGAGDGVGLGSIVANNRSRSVDKSCSGGEQSSLLLGPSSSSSSSAVRVTPRGVDSRAAALEEVELLLLATQHHHHSRQQQQQQRSQSRSRSRTPPPPSSSSAGGGGRGGGRGGGSSRYGAIERTSRTASGSESDSGGGGGDGVGGGGGGWGMAPFGSDVGNRGGGGTSGGGGGRGSRGSGNTSGRGTIDGRSAEWGLAPFGDGGGGGGEPSPSSSSLINHEASPRGPLPLLMTPTITTAITTTTTTTATTAPLPLPPLPSSAQVPNPRTKARRPTPTTTPSVSALLGIFPPPTSPAAENEQRPQTAAAAAAADSTTAAAATSPGSAISSSETSETTSPSLPSMFRQQRP